ncbi:MFS transporter [Aliiruegeria lutimaris]|uniref:Predicted arabinose efflux permease, MFS family n=1 Tax=Aliiruegeria lutimaris TaxID=571298 RepID=A0A1G9E2W0_9RHOB|nr:MFS transporter [Aliiruegeria lutimaris]SDK70454.1 Predicted arabinose efflux permease, MFS family [Aliiruegeria lutimaris]
MLAVLASRSYRHLFTAQIVALLGTGLATVALGLLAYDLAGANASMVLGTVFTIKMVAYVGIAPIAGAFATRWPRRTMLVSLDLVRAAVALLLLFVTEIWQVYLLIFVLQSASAAFTPTFQATIPDLLPDEEDYTKALSLSRLAYDMESLLSPMLAAFLLVFVSFDSLFLGTAMGFAASALLVVSVVLPTPVTSVPRGIYERTTRGLRIYLNTPRLQGLLALNLSVAAAGSMVIVNTVVLVRGTLGLAEGDVALALAAFGGGSMVSALLLPKLLQRRPDRQVMLAGATLLCAILIGLCIMVAATGVSWRGLLVGWLLIGIGYSAVLTPSGRLLRRSAHPEDRPATFAAQFALSHACWLVCYPLSGWLQTTFGTVVALAGLGTLSVTGILLARRLWGAGQQRVFEHSHDDLPHDHPHLSGGHRHSHTYVIDDYHRHWPQGG